MKPSEKIQHSYLQREHVWIQLPIQFSKMEEFSKEEIKLTAHYYSYLIVGVMTTNKYENDMLTISLK